MTFGFHYNIIAAFFFHFSIEFIVYLFVVIGISCFLFVHKYHKITHTLFYMISLDMSLIFDSPQDQPESLAVATSQVMICAKFPMSISGQSNFPTLGPKPQARHALLGAALQVEKPRAGA